MATWAEGEELERVSWAEEARSMEDRLLGVEEAVRQSPGEAEEAVCPGWAAVEAEEAPD